MSVAFNAVPCSSCGWGVRSSVCLSVACRYSVTQAMCHRLSDLYTEYLLGQFSV